MARPPTALEVWQTVQSVIATASGLPTIWRDQNADQPAGDYVDITLGSEITAGIDYVVANNVPEWENATAYVVGDRVINDGGRSYECTTSGTSAASPATGPSGTGTGIVDGSCRWAFVPAGGEVELSLCGTREIVLAIEVWSSATVEELAKVTALTIGDRIVGKLRMPLARDALAAIGFVPFDPGAVQWVPSVVATKFRGRATCDIRCRVTAYSLREFANYIASLSMVAVVENDDATITRTIDAP